jgi:maleate isomerase
MSARIGLLVPSSNVTMEIELPKLLRAQRASFHSTRLRMNAITPRALATMNDDAERCAAELADAECDVLAYACLVAVSAQGAGAHRVVERRLSEAAGGIPVVSSAGALIAGIRAVGAGRITMITPYDPELTVQVVSYLATEGIEVLDAVSLGVTDNRAVGRLDPWDLVGIADRLQPPGAEAIVVSACVQMPSLAVLPLIEARTGLPTLSAATATARALSRALATDRVDRLLAG